VIGIWHRQARGRHAAESGDDRDALPAVVREAQRIVVVEQWRVMAEQASWRLSTTTGLRTTRLFPASRVILVVALDGQVIGRVRRYRRRWAAVPAGRWARVQRFRTKHRALAHLRRVAGSTSSAQRDPAQA
jgi:hypothetical protein